MLVLSYLLHHVHVPQWWSAILGSSGSGQGETNVQFPQGRLFNCSTLQCQEGFSCIAVGNTSLCLPVCGRWAQYPHGTVVAIDVVIILSATICVLASIAVLVLSCIQWERMYVWLNATCFFKIRTYLCVVKKIGLWHTYRPWQVSEILKFVATPWKQWIVAFPVKLCNTHFMLVISWYIDTNILHWHFTLLIQK